MATWQGCHYLDILDSVKAYIEEHGPQPIGKIARLFCLNVPALRNAVISSHDLDLVAGYIVVSPEVDSPWGTVTEKELKELVKSRAS
ncbi:MAG: hypothetical protein ACPL7O_08465, partial [Armatimonadota bacterium]